MPAKPVKVLIVDDEPAMRRALSPALAAGGRLVEAAQDGEQAIEMIHRQPFDLVLLDINMPGMGGIEACRQIRPLAPNAGIVMITVCDSLEEKVRALDAGADDYVTKPFQIRELTARLRSAIRRAKTLPATPDSLTVIGSIMLDPTRYHVEKGGQEIHLSPKEFEMLRYLMQHAGRPVPHNRLLTSIWGPEYGNEREYLRVLISQLRKKIEDDPAHPTYILTESYIGYRFREA
jgi:two-component system, OmpR family, KDP operon response regulator KdpE